MKKRTRWILIVAGVAVVAVVGYLLTASDSGIEVETARVARDTLQVTVSAEGQTRLVESYTVAAPITGRLSRIPFDEGDAILQGRVVARIYPVPESPRDIGVARAQVAAAEARRAAGDAQRQEAVASRQGAATRMAEAEARAEQAEREAARTRALVRDSILSQQEGEQAILAARSARAQVAAARSSLRAAEAAVAASQADAATRQAEVVAQRAALVGANPEGASGPAVDVSAPSSGRVLHLLEKSERVVMAGTPLVEIGDADRIEVVVDVLSEDAVRISPGAAVTFDEWGGEGTLRGEVRRIDPAAFTKVSALGVEEQRVNVIVELIDAPLSLGAGYRVEARIVTWTGTDVLTLPTSALFQQNGVWTVFVVEDGVARTRAVRIGRRASAKAEVLGGLADGDEVVLYPSDAVADGVAVRPASGDASAQ